MLLGMGLMKLGVFSARAVAAVLLVDGRPGLRIGLPLMVFDALELIRHGFSSDYQLHGGIFYNAVRQPDRGPGPCRVAHADRPERRPRAGSPTGWPPWAAWP